MFEVAFIFPGQGAQYVGMGRDLYTRLPEAREIFTCADRILGWALTQLIFNGPAEELTRTVNSQPAIFTVSVACLSALREGHLKIKVRYTAGLSLGEYTALVAASALTFEDGLKLVQKRAEYMQEASLQNPGGMLALIGLSPQAAEEICVQAEAEVANLNCPGQVVISGRFSALDKAKRLAEARGVKKTAPLKTSGAFHSSLMQPAQEKLALLLEKTRIQSPRVPVVSNVTAREENSPQEIRENLARQVASRTRWEESIRFICAQGIKNFLEIGPGRILQGLLHRIDPQLKVYNIERVEDLERFSQIIHQ